MELLISYMKACKQHISEIFFIPWFEKLERENVNVWTCSITPEVRVPFSICSNIHTFLLCIYTAGTAHRRIHVFKGSYSRTSWTAKASTRNQHGWGAAQCWLIVFETIFVSRDSLCLFSAFVVEIPLQSQVFSGLSCLLTISTTNVVSPGIRKTMHSSLVRTLGYNLERQAGALSCHQERREACTCLCTRFQRPCKPHKASTPERLYRPSQANMGNWEGHREGATGLLWVREKQSAGQSLTGYSA